MTLRNRLFVLFVFLALGATGLAVADTITGALAVQGNVCAGSTSCTDTMSFQTNFGADADLWLMSNVPQIMLEDLTTDADDFLLRAQDDTFRLINDTAATGLMTVTAAAAQHSVFVDDAVSGDPRVGIGTNAPESELHLVGSMAALTLEDANSGERWQIQTQSSDPSDPDFFLLTQGAGDAVSTFTTFAIHLDDDGIMRAGLFDAVEDRTPDATWHVATDDGETQILIEEMSEVTATRTQLCLENNGPPQAEFVNTNNNTTWKLGQASGGRFGWSNGAAGHSVLQRPNGGLRVSAAGTLNLQLTPAGNLNILGAYGTLSDRDAKRDIEPVDGGDVLEKLDRMPVSTWSYKHDAGARHLGPMAQDFRAAFGLGADARYIGVADMAGVAIAAVKELHGRVEERDRKIAALEARLAKLEKLLDR